MKKALLLIVLLGISSYLVQAQDSCKVLVSNLQGVYSGDCKKGLAHGKGEARGKDSYVGNFRKGYPHGKGKYIWADSSIYEGDWRVGLREGFGKYVFKDKGKKVVQEGVWKNNTYEGPKPIQPEILQKINVISYSFKRNRDGNQLTLKIMQSGMPNQVMDFDIIYSTGSHIVNGPQWIVQNIEFPFICKITYKTYNKLRTAIFECSFEFKITQPGEWELKLDN